MQAGNTALHIAVEASNADMLKVLVRSVKTVNTPTPTGRTALHASACGWEARPRKARCMDILLRAGARPDAVDEAGTTPLHLAAQEGNLKAVKILVRAGCSQCLRDAVRPSKTEV